MFIILTPVVVVMIRVFFFFEDGADGCTLFVEPVEESVNVFGWDKGVYVFNIAQDNWDPAVVVVKNFAIFDPCKYFHHQVTLYLC